MTSNGLSPATSKYTGELFGHPGGLAVLSATEVWERFSYYGNAALIVLYMVKYLFEPGRVESVLGFGAVKAALVAVLGPLEPQPLASQLFGLYTGLAYFTPVIGGYVADRLLGQRRTVIIGGVLMAIGHFMMAVEQLFLIALLALILGVGAFKPNISSEVGELYKPGDRRRDRGYSIFYVAINVGAFAAPLVCGTLAVSYGWHAGFTAAGVGMLVSLAIYIGGRRWLPQDASDRSQAAMAPQPATGPDKSSTRAPLTSAERSAVLTLVGMCALVTFFWAAYDQQNNTIMLWAEDLTDRSLGLVWWHGEIPAPWFLSINPLMIFLLTPLIVRLWALQGKRGTEPSPIGKMAIGCVFLALANLVMALAAWVVTGKASPLWLVGYFVLATIGELHLAPVGLAVVSRLAPARMLSMMMGIWFAVTLPADVIGGYLGGFWSRMAKADFFLMIGAIAAFAAVAMWLAGIRRRKSEIRDASDS
jgi:POT family proton-dependent oligopeptide transporter